ncbi:substrate-binding periplasmic protein [Dongshaea marina]|uniref:substrate-binding periplasmic protein n=1 Tax=Dongshaea marina TaxID=2047966 RepID=UPI000D3E4CA7|nr:transporter substrate-binding domain-containing protein [Dongshaea marina]
MSGCDRVGFRRLTVFLGALVLLIGSGTGWAGARCVLNMGWEPYQYQEDSHLTGFDIELMRLAATDMGCELKLHQRPWQRGIHEARVGVQDLVAGASMTEERQRWFYYSAPYRTETMALFVMKGTSDLYSFSQLRDIVDSQFRLGINRGVYYGKAFEKARQELIDNGRLSVYNTEQQKYKMFMSGRIDGFLGGQASIKALVKNYLDDVEIYPLKITTSDQYILFSKVSTTPGQVARFNQSLAKLKRSGAYQKLVERFLQ